MGKFKALLMAVFAFMMVLGVMPTATYANEGITISVSGTHQFPIVEVGYEPIPPLHVNVNIGGGSNAFAFSTISLGGANVDAFSVTPREFAVNPVGRFSIVPIDGLPVGLYTMTATVTSYSQTVISPNHIIDVSSFDVSFIVRGNQIPQPQGQQLTLTVESDGAGSYGSGIFQRENPQQQWGHVQPIYAGTHDGYVFSHWTLDYFICHGGSQSGSVIIGDVTNPNTFIRWSITNQFSTHPERWITATAHFERTGTGGGDGVDGEYFNVTVIGGSGSGRYRVGTRVNISAWTHPQGWAFTRWTSSPFNINFNNPFVGNTWFTMPAGDVIIWVDGWGDGGTGGGGWIGDDYFNVTVIGGGGSGRYRIGTRVNINAWTHPQGWAFTRWISSPFNINFNNPFGGNTWFTMPAGDVTIWVDGWNDGGTGGGGGNNRGIMITPSSDTIGIGGGTLQFSATLFGLPQGVSWSLTGGGGFGSINQNGLLTVGSGVPVGTVFTIRVTSTADGSIFDTATVIVTAEGIIPLDDGNGDDDNGDNGNGGNGDNGNGYDEDNGGNGDNGGSDDENGNGGGNGGGNGENGYSNGSDNDNNDNGGADDGFSSSGDFIGNPGDGSAITTTGTNGGSGSGGSGGGSSTSTFGRVPQTGVNSIMPSIIVMLLSLMATAGLSAYLIRHNRSRADNE